MIARMCYINANGKAMATLVRIVVYFSSIRVSTNALLMLPKVTVKETAPDFKSLSLFIVMAQIFPGFQTGSYSTCTIYSLQI